MTVLQWIKYRKCRFRMFVANPIGEILEFTTKAQWRNIPGRLNPADICSRGISAGDLTSEHPWFCGPMFFKDSEDLWPENILVGEPEEDTVETVSVYVCATRSDAPRLQEQSKFIVDLISRYANWRRTIRVVAWMRRIFRVRISQTESTKMRILAAEELEESASCIIGIVQQNTFYLEIASIKKLNPIPSNSPHINVSPFLDNKGIPRVEGRLGRSVMSFDSKHPIIFSHKHQLTRSLILHSHWLWWHASSERTLAQFRQLFWAPGGRIVIKSALLHWLVCRKKNAKPTVPLMSPLPLSRLDPFNPAFTHTGIDYFGPITVTLHRRSHVRYGCLFTCMTTRAVHTEIAHSLDTDSFLMSFHRF